MGEKIRVAQVIGSVFEGGIESCIMNYFKAIDKSQVEFHFFVDQTSKVIDKDIIENNGGKVVIVPHYTHVFSYLRQLRCLFSSGNYDAVHANMTALNFLPLYAAKRAGVKVRIAHGHSNSSKKEFLRNVVKNCLKPFSKLFATHYFACGEQAGRWLFGNKTFEQGNVVIVRNAIDFERFRFNKNIRDDLRLKLGLENCFVIGHIGRFVPQKNHTFIVDIFNEICKSRSDCRLLLVGNGPLECPIKDKISSLCLAEKVVFTGSVANTEEYYNAMDCFILPSLYEGLPVVGIEAQVNGLPCYFSDKVSLEAKLSDLVDFVPIDNPSDWKDIVLSRKSVNRENGYLQMRESGYDIKTEAGKLLEMYRSMCADE